MLEGIDISRFNGRVNPKKVMAAGKKFVVHKLTDGIGSPDLAAATNVRAFRDEGLEDAGQGGYHYLRIRRGRAQDAAVQAAEFFSRMRELSLHFAWLDVETMGNEHVQPDETRAAILIFRSSYDDLALAADAPRTLVHYGSPGESATMGVTTIAELATVPLAVAHYTAGAPHVFSPFTDWLFHQYAADIGNIGTCDGIGSPHCDLDRFNGTIEDLRELG